MDVKLAERLALRILEDSGGGLAAALGYIGDRLGLFKALSEKGAASSGELARRTGLDERYVREWSKAMVAAAYFEYDPEKDVFFMTEEQKCVLAEEDTPWFTAGLFHAVVPMVFGLPGVMEAFRSGGGVAWSKLGGQLAHEMTEGVERSLKPDYLHHLTQSWLPAVSGLVSKLRRGLRVADVGCGSGQSTLVMARAFPRSTFFGIDADSRAIDRARRQAAEEKLSNVVFEQRSANEISTKGSFGLVTAFDCIHDMSDPRGALRAIRGALELEGLFLWQETIASPEPLENRHPVGKFLASVSPLVCLTASLADDGEGLGNMLGETNAHALAREAGFSHFEKLPLSHPFRQFFLLRR